MTTYNQQTTAIDLKSLKQEFIPRNRLVQKANLLAKMPLIQIPAPMRESSSKLGPIHQMVTGDCKRLEYYFSIRLTF